MAVKDFVATVLFLVVAAAGLCPGSEARNYTVADSVGWKVPPSNTTFSDWASQHTFEVGDILIFNFRTGFHDVAVVTKDDFDACNTSSPLKTINTSPASYPLDNDGDSYFICTFPTHCLRGQKLEITVGNSSNGPTASPSPSLPTSFASALSATYMPVIMSILAGLTC